MMEIQQEEEEEVLHNLTNVTNVAKFSVTWQTSNYMPTKLDILILKNRLKQLNHSRLKKRLPRLLRLRHSSRKKGCKEKVLKKLMMSKEKSNVVVWDNK